MIFFSNKNLKTTSPMRVQKMTSEEKEILAKRLYKIHTQIFDGVNAESFNRYVIAPGSQTTKIRIFQNAFGKDVGYINFHVFEAHNGKRKVSIFRTEVCILPEFRKHNATFKILFPECIKAFIKTGFRKAYFLATPVNPAAYKIAAKQLDDVYPNPFHETPAPINREMGEISKSLGLAQEGENPLIKKVGWIVRVSKAKMQRWLNSKDPYVSYYVKQNPGFSEGNGMLMLIPCTFKNGWSGMRSLLIRLRIKNPLRMPRAWPYRTNPQI